MKKMKMIKMIALKKNNIKNLIKITKFKKSITSLANDKKTGLQVSTLVGPASGLDLIFDKKITLKEALCGFSFAFISFKNSVNNTSDS